MLIQVVVFLGLFVTVAAAGLGIWWALRAEAERRTRQNRRNALRDARNHDSWRANKETIMH